MCDPTVIAAVSIATNVVGTGISAVEQNKADKKNKSAAKGALKAINRDIAIRELQERISAEQDRETLLMQAREAAALTAGSAAGGNVGGMTVDMLLQDIENRTLQGSERISDQLKANLSALGRERSGAIASSRNQANRTSPANPFAVGLRIVGAGIDGYVLKHQLAPPVIPGEP